MPYLLLLWTMSATAQDMPEVIMSLSGFNQFVVTDPLGNRTGNDLTNGFTRYREIPSSTHYLEGGVYCPEDDGYLEVEDCDKIPGDIKVFELEDQPAYGTYRVVVQAEQLTWSELWMQPGSKYNFFPSAQDSLETTEYRVTYDPITLDSLLVEKVVTFDSARRELAALNKLGWLASDSLYTELEGRFAQAEDEVALGDTVAAQATLEALDVRIDEVKMELGGNLGPRRERASHLILKENVLVLLAGLEP